MWQNAFGTDHSLVTPGNGFLFLICGVVGLLGYVALRKWERQPLDFYEGLGAFGFGSIALAFVVGLILLVVDLFA